MTTRKIIQILLLFLLVLKLGTANPLLTYSDLFVSEEEGVVKNVEYNQLLSSSEEQQGQVALDKSKFINVNAHPSAETIDFAYKIFLRILKRDSREVTKKKFREVKERQHNEEVSVGRFIITLKRINKLRPSNESREGKLAYDYIKEMLEHTQELDDNENHASWLDNIIEHIITLAQDIYADDQIENIIDKYTMEQEISEHFDIYIQFWLDYRHKRYRRNTNNLTIPTDREIYETLCVIDIQTLPLNTTNITYEAFANILKRDTKKVIEKQFDNSNITRKSS